RRRGARGHLRLPASARGRLRLPQAESRAPAARRAGARHRGRGPAVRRRQGERSRGRARGRCAAGAGPDRLRRAHARGRGRPGRGGLCRSPRGGARDLAGRRVRPAAEFRQWAGSIAFTLYLFLSVPVYALVVLATAPLPHAVRYRTAMGWVNSVLFLLERLCGLGYTVEGLENLPAERTVVLMKHSSAFETIAQLKIFPRQTWVLKRELLWAPFFGWALYLLKPIAIDRRGGRAAVQQVIEQGRQRLDEGLWVIIFPEGTRMPVGQTRRYGLSGTLLAQAVGRP